MQKRYRFDGLRALRVGVILPALFGSAIGLGGCSGEIFFSDIACIRYPVRALDAFSVPNDVALGDFDDDGDQDVAIANSLTGVIFIYVNAGDGSFESVILDQQRGIPGLFPLPIEIFTGGTPFAIAAGDLDGDEIPELVVSDFLNGLVSIIEAGETIAAARNGGRGADIETVSVPAGPVSIALGDIDGDGSTDIVVASITARVSYLLNDGFGQFNDPPVTLLCPGGPVSVALGDVDLLNGLDIVTANSSGGDVSVFLNDGAGSFPARTDFDVGNDPSGVALGDLDGINGPDLAVSLRGDNAVEVRFNDGTGTFINSQTIFGIPEATDVAIAEIDGAFGPEILATSGVDNSLTVISPALRGGAPGAVFATGKAPVAIATGDMNNDGRIDVVVANADSDNVSILRNTPPLEIEEPDARGAFPTDGLLKTHATFDTGVDPTGLVTADFDLDKIPDIVTANFAQNNVSFLKGLGNGRFAPPVDSSAGPAPALIASGRFNEDDLPDLVVVSPLIGIVRILLNNGDGTFTPSDFDLTEADPTGIVAFDVDFDGEDDVVVANGAPGELRVFLVDDDGTFEDSYDVELYLERLVGISPIDFNQDGVVEILALAFDLYFEDAEAEVRSDPPGVILLLPTFVVQPPIADQGEPDTRGEFILLPERPSAIATLFAIDPNVTPPPEVLAARGMGSEGPMALLGVPSADGGTLSLVFAGVPLDGRGGSDTFVLTTESLCFGSDLVGAAIRFPDFPVGAGRGGDEEFLVFWGCPEIQSLIYIDVFASIVRGGFGVAFNAITVEAGQSGLVTNDFDGDGRVDVAVSNQDPDNVTVAMNMGPSGGPWAILPEDVEVAEGETVVLEAKVGGTNSFGIEVQWFKDGNPLSDGGNVSGSNSPTLTITDAAAGDEGAYSIEVEGACGDRTFGDVIVTVAPPTGCLGDADNDGDVDFDDILSVLANFGGSGPDGDADDNGIVDFNDTLTVLANFGAVCAPPFCLGDADGNGVVNFNDTLSVLANFNADYTPGTGPGDADGNGVVDFNDTLTVLANFNAICPGAPDTDGDGVPDVIDGCPENPLLTEPEPKCMCCDPGAR